MEQQDGFEAYCNGRKMVQYGFGPQRMPHYYTVQLSEDLVLDLRIPGKNDAEKALAPKITLKTESFEIPIGEERITGGDEKWSVAISGTIIGVRERKTMMLFVSHPAIGQKCLEITIILAGSGYYSLPTEDLPPQMQLHPRTSIRFEFEPDAAFTAKERALQKFVVRCLRFIPGSSPWLSEWREEEAPDIPFLSIRPNDWQHMPRLSVPVVQWEETFYLPLIHISGGLYEVANFSPDMLPPGTYMLGVHLPKEPKYHFAHHDLYVLPEKEFDELEQMFGEKDDKP